MAPTSTMGSNGENSYARDKMIDKSSVSNVKKTSRGKAVLDVECKNGFRLGFKEDNKVIHANDFASTSTASLVNPKSAQVYKKTKKHIPTSIKVGREGLVMSLVDSQGKLACPLCKKNCASLESLYQHISLDSDRKWHTRYTALTTTHNINESSENHNHEEALIDLIKSFSDWDVKTCKRGRFGSRVADVKVSKASNTKDYSGFIADDHVEKMNAEDIQAANILFLMANGNLSDTEKTMTAQKEVAAAKGLEFLVDRVNPTTVESSVQVEEFRAASVTERQIHVEDSADTSNGDIKMVLCFDLNEPAALEDEVQQS